ncbi:hypothetical protein BGZ60DRAFT_469253 [Tricladium varicosporioides]|nr:hypothetical protein BGZ60DRAFT_469253 [Hymenoscyphus varicosporioides]
MPHKHTRKGEVDKSTIDLPPSTIAKPLSVSKSSNSNSIFTSEITNTRRNNKKRKRNADAIDDTPKAFSRLMAFTQGKKLPKGLDDGVRPLKNKKKKVENGESNNTDKPVTMVEEPKKEMPTIRPGERMAEFSARVDAALPVSGLINKTAKGGKDPLGLKVGRTKKEKKMHRMYAEWREQEKKIQEKREEARELEEMVDEDEDGQVIWKDTSESSSKKGKKRKGKKKKLIGEVDDGESDPWAKIMQERGQKAAFSDVVQAPPTFTNVPKAKFRVDVGDVPKASGSLRRREELGEMRRSVVEGYRAMMKENKAKLGENP